jgi:excisionase family DNA binding protein
LFLRCPFADEKDQCTGNKYPGEAFMEKKKRSESVDASDGQYLDLRKLSVYCSLGVSTLRERLREGTLRFYKIGGKILVRRRDFDAYMERFRVEKSEDLDDLVENAISSLRN